MWIESNKYGPTEGSSIDASISVILLRMVITAVAENYGTNNF